MKDRVSFFENAFPWSISTIEKAGSITVVLVRTGRVELPFPFGSQILSLVRLPIPPRSRLGVNSTGL